MRSSFGGVEDEEEDTAAREVKVEVDLSGW